MFAAAQTRKLRRDLLAAMPNSPRHILLIDDNADGRADLRQMLLRGGPHRYRFSEASLGAEGLRRLLAPQPDPVDCVLLDDDLPDGDAYAVLAALCGEAGVTPCPVVVITGEGLDAGLPLLGAGAQDYIGKRWTTAESLTRVVDNAVERFSLLSERRHAQAALQASEARYRALFNSIDAGYAVLEMAFDAQGTAVDATYLQVNAAFERQSGLRDVVGRTVQSLVPGIEPLWFETYGAVALTGQPVRMEQQSAALNAWYDVHAFRLGEPQTRQVAVLFNDITERKRAEMALIAAKAEAERANRAKSDFLLSMSHELRSPLSAMLGFAQLLESGQPVLQPLQHESVQQILQAGWYLLGLINEILDLTAVESGKQVLSMQPVSLGVLADDCRALVEPQAQAAGVEVRFPCSLRPCPTCAVQPCQVLADATRTKQVLLNLLTNAIKYNRKPGRVEVQWAIVPGHRVRVSVIDTGPGLSAAQMAQLFEPFNRLGQEACSEPGTGIGLVICKRLVELMGGRIGVDSSVGVGCCFWFELDAAPALAVAVPDLPVHTLLCIDSDASRLQAVEQWLTAWPGVCLLRARDVGSGIDIARSVRPDAILMGLHPQGPQAVQAMLLLAKDPATTHIPVIALSIAAAAQNGGPGHGDDTQSPLNFDALERALEQVFQPRPALGLCAAAQEYSPC